MAMTAMAAIKELIDSETFLRQVQVDDPQLAYGVYYQSPPPNIDISTGDIFVLDHKGEEWSYTTESVFFELSCSILIYSRSFERIDQVIGPVLVDLLEDEEGRLSIARCEAYNLEILRFPKGAVEEPDSKGHEIYFGEIDMRLQYQRPRKRSQNDVDTN